MDLNKQTLLSLRKLAVNEMGLILEFEVALVRKSYWNIILSKNKSAKVSILLNSPTNIILFFQLNTANDTDAIITYV